MPTYPRRGEVYWIAFDPSIGGEIQKTRPAVVLSNDAANSVLTRLIVVPISSKTARLFPGEVLIQLRDQTGKAMSDQLSTVSKLRLRNLIARLTDEEMGRLEWAVSLHLGLNR